LAVIDEVMRAGAPQPTRLSSAFSDAVQMSGRTKVQPIFDMPQPPYTAIVVESALHDAAAAMRALYRDRGWLEAKVELQPIEISGTRAQVRFSIVEGRRVFFGAVKYLGGPEGFPPAEKAWALSGEPFSTRRVERVRENLLSELSRRGYTYARAEGAWVVDEDGTVNVTFDIAPGQQVRVGKVLVRGLSRTAEWVVRRQLLVEEGKVLNPDDLQDSQRNMIALGIFRTAEVRLISPETAEPVKDVLVDCVEGPLAQGEFAMGYFFADGPRFVLDGQVPNLGGKAVSLGGHAQVNYFGVSAPALSGRVDVHDVNGFELFGWRGNLSVQNRGLLSVGLAELARLVHLDSAAHALQGADIGTRIDLLTERVFRQSYRFTRVALVPGLDWSFKLATPFGRAKITLPLQFEIDWSRVLPVGDQDNVVAPTLRADQERLRFLFGTFALATVRFAPTIDLRDDPVNPHRGVVIAGAIERTAQAYAQDQSGMDVVVQFVKVSGQVTGYLPIGSVVLALSLRAGKIWPLADGSVTPPVKRFFVGGASSLRGFSEDGLLAEDFRAALGREVGDCEALANPVGCTKAANSLLSGRPVPSQGGELFYIGKAELRFPFIGDINLGIFVEAGDLWLDQRDVQFRLRPVAGTGLRYLSPIGPLALDVGFNLQPDAVVDEAAFNVHFNIGVF
jgi:outer membrane protein insertion porin family